MVIDDVDANEMISAIMIVVTLVSIVVLFFELESFDRARRLGVRPHRCRRCATYRRQREVQDNVRNNTAAAIYAEQLAAHRASHEMYRIALAYRQGVNTPPDS